MRGEVGSRTRVVGGERWEVVLGGSVVYGMDSGTQEFPPLDDIIGQWALQVGWSSTLLLGLITSIPPPASLRPHSSLRMWSPLVTGGLGKGCVETHTEHHNNNPSTRSYNPMPCRWLFQLVVLTECNQRPEVLELRPSVLMVHKNVPTMSLMDLVGLRGITVFCLPYFPFVVIK